MASSIYEPLFRKTISKVETAQQLASWLKIKKVIGQETAESLRQKLPQYIVDAIDYVTKYSGE